MGGWGGGVQWTAPKLKTRSWESNSGPNDCEVDALHHNNGHHILKTDFSFSRIVFYCIIEKKKKSFIQNLSTVNTKFLNEIDLTFCCLEKAFVIFLWYFTTKTVSIMKCTVQYVYRLPNMPILGSWNSAANKDIMSKILTNGDTIFWLSRKHCRKRRNCSLRAISSFPIMFSKAVYCWCLKMSIYGIKG